MNPVSKLIPKGLNLWKRFGAKITFLKSGSVSVPKISLAESNEVVIIASGFHLEETSGPYLLLNPKALLKKLKPIIDKNISFLIYPVINNYGLSFSPSSPEHLLRQNKLGVDYNDVWGEIKTKKCEEVKLVEDDILRMKKIKKLVFGLSLHEDSSVPKKGYLWINGLKDAKARKSILDRVKSLVNPEILLKIQKPEQGGRVEGNFALVEAKDTGSFENWLADELKVPVVLSEAPFGSSMPVKEKFHLSVIESAISNLPRAGYGSRTRLLSLES